MPGRRVALIGLLNLLCLLCADLALGQSSDMALPPQRMLSRYGLERVWWGQALMNPRRDKVQHMTLDEEYLYIQSSSGSLTAFNNETGQRAWAVPVGTRDMPSLPAVSSEDLVLATWGMTIHAVRRSDGRRMWDLRLPSTPMAPPTIEGNSLYVGMLDGSMYAYDLPTVRQLYAENRLRDWTFTAVRWRRQTGGPVATPAIVIGRAVLFASLDGSLYAVATETGDLIYQFETDAPVSAPMSHSDATLYLVSEDFTFYGLNAENGNVIWNFLSGLPIQRQPIVVDGQLFVMPHLGGMYALEAATGRQMWWQRDAVEFLAATQRIVYAADRLGNILLLDQQQGRTLGVLPLPQFKIHVANDRTDRLYLATETGLVMCIRETGREFPQYYRFPDRRPILPEFAPEGAGEDAPVEDADEVF